MRQIFIFFYLICTISFFGVRYYVFCPYCRVIVSLLSNYFEKSLSRKTRNRIYDQQHKWYLYYKRKPPCDSIISFVNIVQVFIVIVIVCRMPPCNRAELLRVSQRWPTNAIYVPQQRGAFQPNCLFFWTNLHCSFSHCPQVNEFNLPNSWMQSDGVKAL